MDALILRGFMSLYKKETARYLAVWTQTVFSPLVTAGLYLLIFGFSLSQWLGESYLSFLISGLVAMSCFNNALQNSASSIMTSKFHNDLQDLKVIPIPAFWISLAYISASIVRGLVCGALVFLLGAVLHRMWLGYWIPIHSPLVLFAFAILGGVYFSCLGIWAGFKSSSFDQLSAITQFIVLPLIYLGGVFFSIKTLSPFWQSVAQLNPLLYMINGLRWGFIGESDVSLALCLGITMLFSVFGIVLAAWGVRTGHYTRF